MKVQIMRAVNSLLEMLECCDDGDFIDRVCTAVSCNDPFSDEEIYDEITEKQYY